ncbi:hypothetical protein AAH973_00160 [Enterococcus faecalis]|uniref:hypothetical protein n=1 Tax=Enterococcus faecalis TaxID=1351 RepID=UPI0031CD9411
MKQIKFKQLATLGLCCSLLMNSLGGVTAFAETVTIESSPTSESTKESTQKSEVSKQEETTKETTGATEKPVSSDAESQEQSTTQESVKNEEPKKIEEKPQQVPDLLQKRAIGVKAGNIVVYEDAVEFPEETYQFGFVNQDGQLVKSDDITITYDYSRYLVNNGTVTWNGIALNQKATTVEKLKKITMPKSILPKNTANGEAMINISFSLPKYYTGLNIYNKSGKIDSNYPLPPRHYYSDNQEVIGMPSDASFITWLTLAKATDNSYVFKDALTSPEPANSSFPMMRRGISIYTYYHSLDAPVYYHLTQRKVTENFKDVNGTAIPAPTGFTQGKKTSITNNDYTFKQSGTLPSTYKASNGKTYQLKGWYKGNTKPATLSTGTPTYKVSYDDNDDLNVVYEEVVPKTVTVPAVDYLFGFINEKGVYDYNAKLTATITEVSGGTVKNGSAITSVPEGVFQKLTIPSKTLTYTETSPAYYGVTKANVQVPKYYKQPTVKPGSYFTGPLGGYPMATIALQNIANGQKSSASVDGSRFDVVPNESAKPNNYLLVSNSWANDTTKTAFSKALSMTTTVNAPSFFTTEDKMFYFLENRRVTENFVDSNGTKITPPTGFTQGKKTVIDNDSYTFTQSGTLPDTYTSGGKTYQLKGWYKGKTPSTTLDTGKPTYKVTYDDNDDLTVVYEEKAQITTVPTITYKFGFINEKGEYVAPTNFAMTTNLTEVSNATAMNVGTATGTNVGNLKQLTIPGRQLTYTKDTNPSFYGATDFRLAIPKYYQTPTVTPGTHYSGSTTAYPIATTKLKYVSSTTEDRVQTDGQAYRLYTTNTANSYSIYRRSWSDDTTGTIFSDALTRFTTQASPAYYTTDDTMFYFLENRRVTENFVDSNGTKITPPTDFTQGKQTVIDSDNFTYTQEGTLPYIYKINNKPYILKGWYKGKNKPEKLNQITKDKRTISYPVSYDDQMMSPLFTMS